MIFRIVFLPLRRLSLSYGRVVRIGLMFGLRAPEAIGSREPLINHLAGGQ